ncbi:agmatine deiminase family protein [Paenibacillus sp. 1001270B_150601_E10]|uniref:agmatine deiminase family protein n=1 Tax=Paenibacillus sp. 1001270B_150601_E10 TaxID=2787079 RepID=UPI00189D2634|nr:agmatine deiminase family protein [Paenibacillus sp. 1001270B_150601_E10]
MKRFRTVGEFEQQESVLLIWPIPEHATRSLNLDRVSVQVVQALMDEVEVMISCFDEEVEKRAQRVLQSHGVDIGRIRFVPFPSEIVYPRDFGAEVMINDEGERARADFRFNMYGFYTEQDEISRLLRGYGQFHAEQVGIEHTIHADLISEGGDREFNGRGVMMAIQETEVDKRNPDKSVTEVEEEFKNVFGLDQIIWLPRGTYDDEHPCMGPIPSADGTYRSYRSASANGHIDEMCRFVGPDTVILAYVPEEEAKSSELHALNKERLDMAYEALQSARTVEGKPYTILKMPMPEPIYIDLYPEDEAFQTWEMMKESLEEKDKLFDGSPFPTAPINVLPALSYCNFLIANGVVLAQKYYEEGMPEQIREKDEEAFEVLKKAFPDRRIVQINTLALNLYGGGIHCHTRNIPAALKKQ